MLWLLLLVGVQACPEYRCADLVSGRCAEIYGEVVFVNSRACPQESYCWASEIQRAYSLGLQTVDCTSRDPSEEPVSASRMCAEYDTFYSQFRLSDTKPHPWQCLSDIECVLYNGQSSQCVCGLDGGQYCALHVGDSVLHDWAKTFACNEEKRYAALWDYINGYVYLQGNGLACEDTIEEVARAKPFKWVLPEQFTFETEPKMASAVALGLSLLTLTLL